jgi:peptidoglycan/LPS O-acetylase OafA/YrhL
VSAGIYAVQAFGWWGDIMVRGGLNWPSLLRSTLEALIAAGLSVGLVVLFREVFHRPSRLLVAMATASYAAYILHLYIVVGLQIGFGGLELPAVVKFAMVAVLGTALAFGLAHLSRRVPGMRIVLGTTPATSTPSTAGRSAGPTAAVR